MRAHPVGPGLDQRRPVARPRPCDGARAGVVDGEEVVAVDELAGDPVAGGAVGEARGRRLLAHGRRDGPAVVLEQEDDRRAPHAGEVQRLVRVALGGRAVAEVDADDAVGPLVAQAPGQPDRVRDLRRQRDLEGQHPDAVGDVAAGGVAAVVLHRALQRVALAEHRGQLAVLRARPSRAPGRAPRPSRRRPPPRR